MKLRRIFSNNARVKFVKNSNRQYHLESIEYFRVLSDRNDPMLFTKTEVDRAIKRAQKNPEELVD